DGRSRHRAGWQIADGCGTQPIDPHWSRDVLYALLAHVVEGVGRPIADLVVHCPGNADAAWLSDRFQTCRDIDPIAVNVFRLSERHHTPRLACGEQARVRIRSLRRFYEYEEYWTAMSPTQQQAN